MAGEIVGWERGSAHGHRGRYWDAIFHVTADVERSLNCNNHKKKKHKQKQASFHSFTSLAASHPSASPRRRSRLHSSPQASKAAANQQPGEANERVPPISSSGEYTKNETRHGVGGAPHGVPRRTMRGAFATLRCIGIFWEGMWMVRSREGEGWQTSCLSLVDFVEMLFCTSVGGSGF